MKNFTYKLQILVLTTLTGFATQCMETNSLAQSETQSSEKENRLIIKEIINLPDEIKYQIILLAAVIASLDYPANSPVILPLEKSPIYPTAFSSDGQIIVIGFDKIASLWSAKTGKFLFNFAKKHTNTISSVAFSPCDKIVLTGSFDTTARLWDITTGELIKVLKGHESQLISVAFSSDGSTILTQSKDGTIYLWDITNIEAPSVITLAGKYKPAINKVAFSPQGTAVLTGSDDGSVCLWDGKTGELFKEFKKEHTEKITAVAFAPHGEVFLTGSEDAKACLWSTEAESVTILQHTDSVILAIFNPTGESVLDRPRL